VTGTAQVALVVHYQAAPGNGDEVAALLARHSAATQAEPGCRAFTALRLEASPDSFVLCERYASREAFDAHVASPHYQNIAVARIRPLLSDRTVEFCQVIEPDD
jgi:quinol monooxygenase YgiN